MQVEKQVETNLSQVQDGLWLLVGVRLIDQIAQPEDAHEFKESKQLRIPVYPCKGVGSYQRETVNLKSKLRDVVVCNFPWISTLMTLLVQVTGKEHDNDINQENDVDYYVKAFPEVLV